MPLSNCVLCPMLELRKVAYEMFNMYFFLYPAGKKKVTPCAPALCVIVFEHVVVRVVNRFNVPVLLEVLTYFRRLPLFAMRDIIDYSSSSLVRGSGKKLFPGLILFEAFHISDSGERRRADAHHVCIFMKAVCRRYVASYTPKCNNFCLYVHRYIDIRIRLPCALTLVACASCLRSL